jgi:hypothetical protein
MMITLEQIAKQKGYTKLKIKTRNNRREMLGYVVQNGWNFIDVEKHPGILSDTDFL